MASSSGTPSVSVICPKEKHDVFISFRGKDTRNTFTCHLYAALIRRKVKTYIDDRLEKGYELGPALLKAIKESKISVIIFSENYADSTWCLDELAHILECKETQGQHVIPVFYEVEPSDVRYQKRSYETAFAQHIKWLKDDKTEKMAKWKEALVKAANLSGLDSTSKTVRHDSDLVDQVVAEVLAKLNRESSTDLTGLIGAEGRIQKILLELDMVPEDVRVRFLVVWGMGGIGKTTLADAVYHGLSSNFETHCFLANVRERSGTDEGAFSQKLFALRNELLRELLGDRSLEIRTRTIGAVEKERLRRTKVLVVLDDVNDSSQLTFLADEVPFGPGSRIIITTRDMQPVKGTLVLKKVANRDVKMHEVEKLNGDESLQLFYSDQSDSPTCWTGNVESLQWRVLDYADGIPLALNILRPLFLQWEGKPEEFWEYLKDFPNEELQNVYRASYNVLKKNEKEIFLDIACFHRWEELCDAKRIMAACGLFPDNGIKILIDMSLISIRHDHIWMHDVIQEMGREIVREECVDDAGKRSRLYTFEDACHVLERNKGTAAVKGISLKTALNVRNVMLTGKAFTEMDNLRFLDFGCCSNYEVDVNTDHLERLPDALKFLSWPRYSLKSLPSNFSLENLVELHMRESRLQGLWNQGQRRPKNLRRIDLSYSSELTEVPDLSICVDIESINLKGCSKVRKLPELPCNMKFLDLNGTALEELPSSIWSIEKLVELNLHSYRGQIPNVTWNLKSITSLVLTGTRVESVPSSIENLSEVVSIELGACKSLVSLPTTICKLKSLERLDLRGCTELKMFPEIEEPMERLEYLSLRKTGIEQLPQSIGNIIGLKTLDLTRCNRLELLPSSIYKLKHLERLDLRGCTRLEKFPEIEEKMERLEYLSLQETGIEELPPSIGNLVGLKTLDLTRCFRLELLPSDIYKLEHLENFLLKNCGRLTKLPVSSTILCSLISLDLYDCNLLEAIPEGLISSTSLQSLNLSGTMIQSINPTIKHASGLMYLNISNCKCLQSLPQLPCVPTLVANGCPTLKTVSYPMAAPTQYLDQTHSFCGSINLDENTRNNMMDDARLRIARMANDHPYLDIVTLICPGIEIPNWFSCEKEGSFIKIKLPQHWSDENFLGFALSAVLPFYTARSVRIQCVCILTTDNKPLHQLNLFHNDSHKARLDDERSDHLLVVYRSISLPDIAKFSTEVSFEFSAKLDGQFIEVKRCGVCFLYAQGQDHDLLKFEVIDTEHATSGTRSNSYEPESCESETSSGRV